jgi:phosphatidylserine/phosphatidylglycerophosphate/cardiolipin synthase-like enzyme
MQTDTVRPPAACSRFLLALAAVWLVVCSARPEDAVESVPEPTPVPAVLPALPKQPIFVMFNNAYSGLVEDNEQTIRADPHSPYKYLLSLIGRARKSIALSCFDIDDPEVAEALIAARRRGVQVEIVTDTDNIRDKLDPSLPRAIIEEMAEAGIVIRDDKRRAFMHQKYMVVDRRMVWLGSMNLSSRSLYHHNNNAVLIQSRPVAANFQREFTQLFRRNEFDKPPARLAHPRVAMEDATVRTYFSPRGGTREAILELVSTARTSIYFMAFAFTDRDLATALIAKSQAGLKVEGVFDNCMIDRNSVFYYLRDNEVPVWRDGNQALMHHKILVVDNRYVVTGSYNFSMNAAERNTESTVIIDSRPIARLYAQEFGRLKYAAMANRNLPPYDHPACNRRGGRLLVPLEGF